MKCLDEDYVGRKPSKQSSKLGWSCGPSLPKLLADHQIVLCGGPVVYWKLLILTNFLKCAQILFMTNIISFFNTIYLLQGIFKCLVHGSRFLSAVFDFIKTNVLLALDPDHRKFDRTTRLSGLVVRWSTV